VQAALQAEGVDLVLWLDADAVVVSPDLDIRELAVRADHVRPLLGCVHFLVACVRSAGHFTPGLAFFVPGVCPVGGVTRLADAVERAGVEGAGTRHNIRAATLSHAAKPTWRPTTSSTLVRTGVPASLYTNTARGLTREIDPRPPHPASLRIPTRSKHPRGLSWCRGDGGPRDGMEPAIPHGMVRAPRCATRRSGPVRL
jgi:hypothetical protein